MLDVNKYEFGPTHTMKLCCFFVKFDLNAFINVAVYDHTLYILLIQ